MKKTLFTTLAAGLISTTGLKAQTLQDGVAHLYADRFQSATKAFEQLLAANPNNIEAIYWLGQTYLESDEIMSSRIKQAKQLYEKANQATNGAPLVLVGLGHVELLENKINEARQHFEIALTNTRTKKGDDPVIATAVGRAINDSKNGDYKYAIQLLDEVTSKDKKNAAAWLQLGNAYRKDGKGTGGGSAFESYNKALSADPNFAPASLRLAQLFESQKNWELVFKYLTEAVQKDPKFTAAYYELFYYYFNRSQFSEAEAQLQKYINSKLPETDIQDQYLYAQLCWAKKDFDCAVQKANTVVNAMGENTKPKVYRLLADAYLQKGDFESALKNSDLFFAKKNPEDVILPDYETKAEIVSKLGGTSDDVLNLYLEGASLDTTVDAKIGFLKKGANYFKEKNLRDKEAQLIERVISLKTEPTINDYFDAVVAYYFAGDYFKSRDKAVIIRDKFPDQVYGYEWAYNNSVAITTDTLTSDSLIAVYKDSLGAPDANNLHEFAQKDTTKFKKQYINAVKFLAAYYINDKKDKDNSLLFFRKWLEADPANASVIQSYIDQIEKMPSASQGRSSSGQGSSSGQMKTKDNTVSAKNG